MTSRIKQRMHMGCGESLHSRWPIAGTLPASSPASRGKTADTPRKRRAVGPRGAGGKS
jgi:hypothetical protein